MPNASHARPGRFAEVRLQVRVELDQARHHRQVRGVDDLARCGSPSACGTTLVILLPSMTMSTLARGVGALHVDELAGVDDAARVGRNRRRVLQIERHGARLAGLDVDDPQLVDRLIEDVARIALPARRVRALGRDAARRTERLAGGATPATPRARPRRSPPSWCRRATTPGRSRRASRSTSSACGANHLSSFSRRSTTSSGSGWCLRGSACVIGAMPAIARRLPSGDQAGAPGCGSES